MLDMPLDITAAEIRAITNSVTAAVNPRQWFSMTLAELYAEDARLVALTDAARIKPGDTRAECYAIAKLHNRILWSLIRLRKMERSMALAA